MFQAEESSSRERREAVAAVRAGAKNWRGQANPKSCRQSWRNSGSFVSCGFPWCSVVLWGVLV